MRLRCSRARVEKDAEVDELNEYRQWLVTAHQSSSQAYDKAIMTLAGGALAISLTFIHDVAPHPVRRNLLVLAWLLLALSLLLILVSHLTSQEAILNQIADIDEPPSTPRRDMAGWLTTCSNWGAGASFVAGVVLFVIFAWKNV
jgi:hypothetical protein